MLAQDCSRDKIHMVMIVLLLDGLCMRLPDKAFQARLRASGRYSQALSQAKLKQATINFGTAIGQGGFGDMFYGNLPDGKRWRPKCCQRTHIRVSMSSSMRFRCSRRCITNTWFLFWDTTAHARSRFTYTSTSVVETLNRHRLQGENGATNPLSWRQKNEYHPSSCRTYHETGLLTESDVYAFGIVLMEIFTGRHHMHIAQKVGNAWRQEKFDGLADPNLGENFDKEELVSLVELALWCMRKSSMERPFIRQVVGILHDVGLASSEAHPALDGVRW